MLTVCYINRQPGGGYHYSETNACGESAASKKRALRLLDQIQFKVPIGFASANSVESDLGCTSRFYFDNVTLTLYNVTLTSQNPCQHNHKCDCSRTNG